MLPRVVLAPAWAAPSPIPGPTCGTRGGGAACPGTRPRYSTRSAAAGSARDQRRDPAFGKDTLTAITWYATGERIEPWVQQWSNSSALGCIRDALASVYPHWLADPTGQEPDRFFAAVDAAVKCGGDADTVAAVAGGLAGAIWGMDAIPDQDILHGYPGWTVTDLTTRSDRAVGHSTDR